MIEMVILLAVSIVYINALILMVYVMHGRTSFKIWDSMIARSFADGVLDTKLALRSFDLWVKAIHGCGNPKPLDL
jgi:hypothetical protein